MKEVFKPVPYKPYNLNYEISNMGSVRPIVKSKYSHMHGEFLRWGVGARGYPCVTFYYNRSHKQCFVHRMVLLAFVGQPPKGKPLALHLDDDKQNNHLDNLQWGSPQDNMDLMIAHGRQNKGKNVNTAKLDETQVITIRKLYQEGSYSQVELAATFGVDQTQISRIVLRKCWNWL